MINISYSFNSWIACFALNPVDYHGSDFDTAILVLEQLINNYLFQYKRYIKTTSSLRYFVSTFLMFCLYFLTIIGKICF